MNYSSVTADQENSSLAVTGHWENLKLANGLSQLRPKFIGFTCWGGFYKFSLVKKDHDDAEF